MKRFALCLLALGMIFSLVPSLGCECGGPESALTVTVSPKEVEPGGEITVTVEVSPPQETELQAIWLDEELGPFFTDASGEFSGVLHIDPQLSAGEYELVVRVPQLDLVDIASVTVVAGMPPLPPSVTGTITVGAEVEVITDTISPSGGTICVDKPGDPVDGLEVEVPANSYPEARAFRVSHAPITGHPFGEDFNPISPLITIDIGGGYSEELMTVKIPVEIPENHFAMAFFYDEKGELEGIPLLAEDSQSVTVATRHFSDIAVGSIDASFLRNKEIDTGFKPGVDDWQFGNYGSYIEPRGQCSGQCLSAIWYYYEKWRNGAEHLYGLYDNNQGLYEKDKRKKTLGLWEDDNLGYRFACTVHKDVNWENLTEEFITFRRTATGELTTVGDDVTWNAFAYSMHLTGVPQLVLMYDTATEAGHTILVYKISANGSLHVADPNYSGDTSRQIKFVDGKFEAYDSVFDLITYIAKTALVPWSQIAKRWEEFKDETIGNDTFPAYTLYWTDDQGKKREVTGDFTTEQEKVKLWAESPTVSEVSVKVYRDVTRLEADANGKFELKEGNNPLGITVRGKVGDNYEYINFERFTVTYTPPAEPPPVDEKPSVIDKEEPPLTGVLVAEGGIIPYEFASWEKVVKNYLRLDIDTGTGRVTGVVNTYTTAEAYDYKQQIDMELEGTYTKGEEGKPDTLQGTYKVTIWTEVGGKSETGSYSSTWVAEMDSEGMIEGTIEGEESPTGFEAIVLK